MKKILVIVTAVMLLGALPAPSFALLKANKTIVKGKVVTADPRKGEISIIERGTGRTLVYRVLKPYYANFAPGADVAIIVDKKSGVASQVNALRPGR